MEFLGPKTNPKNRPKIAQDELPNSPRKKQRKPAFIAWLPPTHGRAWGRTATRAWWHGRATRHGVAVPLCWLPARFGLVWRTVVRLHSRPCFARFRAMPYS